MFGAIAGALLARADVKMIGAAQDGALGVLLFRQFRQDITLPDPGILDMCGVDASSTNA